MSQRVNIQYSVELDKLSETVSFLYNNAMLRMKRLNDSMLSLNSGLDLEMIEQIDMVRLELAQIDIQLADLDKIVKGYLSYKTNQRGQDEKTEDANTAESDRNGSNQQDISINPQELTDQ